MLAPVEQHARLPSFHQLSAPSIISTTLWHPSEEKRQRDYGYQSNINRSKTRHVVIISNSSIPLKHTGSISGKQNISTKYFLRVSRDMSQKFLESHEHLNIQCFILLNVWTFWFVYLRVGQSGRNWPNVIFFVWFWSYRKYVLLLIYGYVILVRGM